MERLPARVLEEEDVRRVLAHIATSRYPLRNRVIVLLSFKAGLRACEISGLTWPMVLRTDCSVDDQMRIARHIAKYGSARTIPMHPDLRKALSVHHRLLGRPRTGYVICSERKGRMTPRSIVNWFSDVYATLALPGCSSHSGRRTFITRSARAIVKVGGSLRDVQELAGHRALTTTERYIMGDREAQRQLMRLI
ncbi:site-specific integrase [Sphingorhabdus pulchriflava]|jgi:integrase/recombinase XerD|uniref:Site-specific integrase n=1 Tax=Sphingorhabdus pulchriflava TaxID=2292257 RepID=A0A371BJ44_9SPHN|nr:tyrosine-type recombinase/integrase [Sphingorhabdus pulchriflava]RDV07381.1 site-specific integrase [Sphingorhabdus pulchriflava]